MTSSINGSNDHSTSWEPPADTGERWHHIQSEFVDDPRKSVAEAHQLVSDLLKRVVDNFTQERGALERQWSEGERVSTEELRVCLQRYRAFFSRLLPSAPSEHGGGASDGNGGASWTRADATERAGADVSESSARQASERTAREDAAERTEDTSERSAQSNASEDTLRSEPVMVTPAPRT
jgi:hypothetical protein